MPIWDPVWESPDRSGRPVRPCAIAFQSGCLARAGCVLKKPLGLVCPQGPSCASRAISRMGDGYDIPGAAWWGPGKACMDHFESLGTNWGSYGMTCWAQGIPKGAHGRPRALRACVLPGQIPESAKRPQRGEGDIDFDRIFTGRQRRPSIFGTFSVLKGGGGKGVYI